MKVNTLMYAGIILMVVMLGIVYAGGDLTSSNYKDYTLPTDGSKYGAISVYDSNLLTQDKKVAEYTLTENNPCLLHCSLKGTVILYSTGKLFDGAEFIKVNERTSKSLSYDYYIKNGTESYQVDVPDYTEVCKDIENKTTARTDRVCTQEQIGTHKETRTRDVWKKYNSEQLSPGTYYWDLRVVKGLLDQIDAIPIAYEQKFSEWAVWSSSFNVNLRAYYTFNESTGTKAYNVANPNFNLTVNGTTPNWAGGLINGSYKPTGEAEISSQVNLTGTSNATFSFWAYRVGTITSGGGTIINDGNCGLNNGEFDIGIAVWTTDNSVYTCAYTGGTAAQTEAYVLPVTTWTHIAVTFNYTKELVYINGVLNSTIALTNWVFAGSNEGGFSGKPNLFTDQTGGRQIYNLRVDEMGIWNRTLSASEVTDLYNSGAGLTYGSIDYPSLNMTSPANNTNSFANVTFTCNTTTPTNPLANLTLRAGTNVLTVNGNGVLKYLNISTTYSFATAGTYIWNCSSADNTNLRTSSESRTFNILDESLYVCNKTYNITYINYTFYDQITSAALQMNITSLNFNYNAQGSTKTLSYSNSIGTTNVSVCSSNPAGSYVINGTIVYQNPSYPQKSYYDTGTFTNATTERHLTALGTSNGIYSTYQVMNVYGQTVAGAGVVVETQIGGVWTTVDSGVTDSAGAVTFWLNFQGSYRITVTATGYLPSVNTITPSQSLYTIVLSSTTFTVNSSTLQGVYWFTSPPSGLLVNGMYLFQFNVTALNGNMQQCRFDLTNTSNSVLATNSTTCTYSANLSLYYNFTQGEIWGKYYINFGNGYIMVEGDGLWKNITQGGDTSNTLAGFFKYLSDPTIWATADQNTDEYRRYEFTRIVGFFLLLALLAAAANIFTGFDSRSPGYFLFGLPLVLTLVSVAGGLDGQGFLYIAGATPFQSTALNSLIVAIYSWMIAGAMYFVTQKREG